MGSVCREVLEQAGGSIPQWLAYFLLDPAALGLIPNIPKNFSAEENCPYCRGYSMALVRGKWTVKMVMKPI